MVAVKSHMEAAKFVSNVNFVVVRPHSLYLEVFLVAKFVASGGLQFQKRPIFWGYEPSTQIWIITKEMRKYLKNKNRKPPWIPWNAFRTQKWIQWPQNQ